MANVEISTLTSEQDFNAFLVASRNSLVVVHFLADWAPQCAQVTDVLKQLTKDKACTKVKFVQIEAEEVPEISIKYEIEAVPTVILLHLGKVLDRVNGVKVAELTQKVRRHSQNSVYAASDAAALKLQPSEDLNTKLKRLINTDQVMVFMKGDPAAPRCGFSKQVVSLLRERNVNFGSFDILSDEEVRQGLKSYSNWPTYPQIYVNGELIGGLDIVKELIENEEFADTFPVQAPLEERLKTLVNKSPIMLFMKGNPETPRCGFSKQTIDLLNGRNVTYDTFDILQDEEIRQGLKEYSDWPTYPQLYVNGEFIGGLDIIKELDSSGELEETLKID